MKKYFFLLTFFVSLSMGSVAQTLNIKESKSGEPYSGMYFQGGLAFPMLDLGKGDPTNSSSGMAALGYHVELGYSRQVTNNFGYKASSFYFGNSYSTNKYDKFYQGLTGASHSASSKEGWSVGGLLLKPFYYVPVSENITWEIYGSAGLAAYYTPQYSTVTSGILVINGQPVTSSTSYNWDRSKGVSFIYGLGTQFSFNLFNTNLFVSSEFLVSRISYTKTGSDSNNHTYSDLVKSKLGYVSVNIGYIVYF